MACDAWVEPLSARLDSELGPDEEEALGAHLASCPECRDLAARLERQNRRVRVHAAPTVPDLTTPVLAVVSGPRRSRRVGVAAAIAAAVVIGMGSGALVSSRRQSPPLLALADGVVLPAPRGGASELFLDVANNGGSDRVVAASSPVATRTELHVTQHDNGMMVMRAVTSVAVPGGVGINFAPDATHLMLEGLRSDLRQGQHVVVVLTFARAGVVTLSATVSDVPGLTA